MLLVKRKQMNTLIQVKHSLSESELDTRLVNKYSSYYRRYYFFGHRQPYELTNLAII